MVRRHRRFRGGASPDRGGGGRLPCELARGDLGLSALGERVESLLGRRVTSVTPLHGGCIGEVMRLRLDDGSEIVAKTMRGSGGDLALEGWMLSELRRRSSLPVPEVLAASPDLLLMTYLAHDPGASLDARAQRHAAELVAALHEVRGSAFGDARATVIGPLPQPNPKTRRWIPFFRDQRLLHMAGLAHSTGRLPVPVMARIERLAAKLDDLLEEPAFPSLLHGDLWAGNVLVANGRIAGFVDPAIYHGHPEIELAFSTLFGSFGEPFFRRYRELRPIAPGFFDARRDLYNLYPLLVHLRLFGGSYLPPIERTLRRFGC